jgi:hypothetical protein
MFKYIMSARRLRNIFWAGVFLLLAVAAVAQIAKGFRYPDYDEKGQLRFEIVGDQAQVQPDGLIHIVNLKLTFYEQGKIMMQVSTPQCLFDRVKRTAVSTSEVWMARKEIELTGRGFIWNAEDGRMEIHNQARLVLRNMGESSIIGDAP